MENWRREFKSEFSINNITGTYRNHFQNLIEKFKIENPELMLLKPEIGISNIISKVDENNPESYIILVGHKFIFDYRLIPDQFDGYKVHSKLCEQMPSIFPSIDADTQIEVYHDPERYKQFVDNNINKIRRELNSLSLSKDEALDALTNGFDKHNKWVNTIKKERLSKHGKHIEFFHSLLDKTEELYKQSEVYKKYGNYNWGYSITSTSFYKNEKCIVGLNWGVDKSLLKIGKSHGKQNKYPLVDFANLGNDLGSFRRTIKYFHMYFDHLPKVQTNYCFFRSENESQIQNDLILCSKLFESLMEYLQPSMIISFSKALNSYFEDNKMLKPIENGILEIQSGNKIISVIKGIVEIGELEVKYVNLPHPNYPMQRSSRDKAWEFCFGENKRPVTGRYMQLPLRGATIG